MVDLTDVLISSQEIWSAAGAGNGEWHSNRERARRGTDTHMHVALGVRAGEAAALRLQVSEVCHMNRTLELEVKMMQLVI